MELRKSNRSLARIRLALQGPSGSGKTLSALKIAYGITNDWTRIAIIDTENKSADLYSHLGPYSVLNLQAPFTPERYIEAIEKCESAGMDVIIIDSLSHEWEGEGGILDVHSKMIGNSFTNWSKLTPKHNALLHRMLASGKHIIATVRSKQEYVISDKNGKSAPEKVGMKGIQREGFDYEFTTLFEIDINHNATCTKDRSQLFKSKSTFMLDENIGKTIASWCKEVEGFSDKEILALIRSCKTLDELNYLYKHKPHTRSQVSEYNHRAAVIKGEVEEYKEITDKQHENKHKQEHEQLG